MVSNPTGASGPARLGDRAFILYNNVDKMILLSRICQVGFFADRLTLCQLLGIQLNFQTMQEEEDSHLLITDYEREEEKKEEEVFPAEMQEVVKKCLARDVPFQVRLRS